MENQKKYYTYTKANEYVEVSPELAKELVNTGKKKPEDFEIEETSPTQKDEKSVFRKGWELLKKPEELSRKGLKQIAESIPEPDYTQESSIDPFTRAIPKVAAETLAEVAPSFVSPESIVLGGGLRAVQKSAQALKPVGKWLGRAAEEASGLRYRTPEILTEAFQKPTLMFSKGLEKARETYKNLKGVEGIRKELKAPLKKEEYVNKALELLDNGEDITAEEALEARKALDSVRKKLTDVGYKETRELFDNLAKQKFLQADIAYQNAVKGEELRRVFPLNKGGTPSIFKVGIGGATLGKSIIATSPILQSAVASGLGALYKAPATVGTVAKPIYKTFKEKVNEYRKGKQ